MYQQKIELLLTNCKGITISEKKFSLKRLFYQQEKFLILLQSFISCSSNFVTGWLVECSPISLFATYIHYIHKA
jgi:hypothetical protein